MTRIVNSSRVWSKKGRGWSVTHLNALGHASANMPPVHAFLWDDKSHRDFSFATRINMRAKLRRQAPGAACSFHPVPQ